MHTWKNQLEKTPQLWWQQRQSAFFVYSESRIEENYKKFALNSHPFFYSVKANPQPQILKKLNQLGLGVDVSSLAEWNLVRQLGFTSDRITVSGPAKLDSWLQKLKQDPPHCVHLDSIEEWHLLKNQPTMNLAVRVSVQEGVLQKVGLPPRDLQIIFKEIAEKKGVPLKGIHVYLGRERFSESVLNELWKKIVPLWSAHQKQFVEAPQLFLGGGFPDLQWLKGEAFKFAVPSPWKMSFEAGRALIHTAGVYIAPVLSIKNPNLLIIQGGLQHLASKLSSPVFAWEHTFCEVLRVPHKKETSRQVLIQQVFQNDAQVQVYGSLGVWHDEIYRGPLSSPNIQRGTWLMMGPAGSYGLTAASQQFLGLGDCEEFWMDSREVITDITVRVSRYLQSKKIKMGGQHESQSAAS